MLEGLVASLLNRLLGMYIRNFDPKQLNIGIWSGDVTLRDLELRREALDQLRLPINVVEGHVGLLTLSIPWSNLKGKPVKVFIEDVYLLAAPKENDAYDEEEEAKRQHALKMERLDSKEMLQERTGDGLSKEEQLKHQSFTENLVTKIVDNLQISMKRIHFRYEDSVSAPEHPFSLGLTIEEFSAVSTDAEWNPAFIQVSGEVTHKLVSLGALAIYWNTDSALLGTGKGTQAGAEGQGINREHMLEQLQNYIVGADTPSSTKHQFVLRPVNGRAMVEMDKTGKHDRAKLKAGLLFEEIGVVLDDDQLRDALMMLDLFHYFNRRQQYRKYEPKGVTVQQDPRAWIRFAGNVVLDQIHDRNQRWSWAFMKERRDDRKSYINLFKKKKKGEQALTPAEAAELEKLEKKLAYQDLAFWRSLARRELRKENAIIKKSKDSKDAKQSQGWVAWMWGSGKQQQQQQQEEQQKGADDEILTDEQRKKLFDALDWDEKNAIAANVDLPRDAVKLQVEASLRTGSFTLKQDPHGINKVLLSLLSDNFKANVLQRPDSLLAKIGLGGLRAYDGPTDGDGSSQLVEVKEAQSSSERMQLDESTAADGNSPKNEDTPTAEDRPFFELEYEQNPLEFPGYQSSIYLRCGSIKINFMQEPFRKITEFFVKFGKMQAIVNSATQVAINQANQIQENVDKTRLDIVVKTPIVVFPRAKRGVARQLDVLTAYLGEIYASSEFVPLDESERPEKANKLSAGIRDIRLTSDFHYQDDKSQELEIINKVDLDFEVTYLQHIQGSGRPDLEVRGSMSDVKLRLTQIQLRLLMELSESVPAAFSVDTDEDTDEVEAPVPSSAPDPAEAVTESPSPTEGTTVVHLGPELGVNPGTRTKLDLIFTVGSISLELINAKAEEPLGDLSAASLSKFSLDGTSIKLRMVGENSVESELLVRSFTIRDSRNSNTNKFRKIMSSINKDVQQFMASVTMSGGRERNLVGIITIDSPRIIFALDYLFALQSFVMAGLALEDATNNDNSPRVDPLSRPESAQSAQSTSGSDIVRQEKDSQSAVGTDEARPPANPMSLSFRLNLVDAQVILIANPSIAASEAIVLGIKQVLMSQQHALTLQVSQVGVFLCRMDKFEDNRLRILDDFSLQLSMQTRSQDQQASLTSIHLAVEPLVLRLSLRDILLALQIVNKASELSTTSSGSEITKAPAQEAKEPSHVPKQSAISSKRASIGEQKLTRTGSTERGLVAGTGAQNAQVSILSREEMIAELEGMRLILIGDLHELPLLDLSIQDFKVGIRDWSGQMNADTSVDLYLNIYNFSKSIWEPLIEPWQLGLHVSRDQTPERLALDLYSRKMLELTLTPASIALASKSAKFFSQDEDVLSKPRGVDAPHRIRNHTGFDVSVWADRSGKSQENLTKLTDGAEAPWRFENWEKMRENLSPEGYQGTLGIRLEGSGFEDVHDISVTREGETVFNLRPKRDNVMHRLLVEVRLSTDNVKYVTIRSPMLVENNTQIPIEIGVFDSTTGDLLKIEKIMPEDSRPAPVGAAFMHSLLVRPDQGFGYTWSNEQLHWKSLLKRSTLGINCKPESQDGTAPFLFQASANYDPNHRLTGIYPYMRIKLSAPLELENLLPYDFKYRIYDKQTKKDWTNFLRKGGLSPVHVVDLSHLLLMSIDMQDAVFKQSEFAIINSSHQEDFHRENSVTLQDKRGLTLNLKLHYYNIPNSGGAFRVSVYSPYIILNKTGVEISVKSKSLLQTAQSAAGQGLWENEEPREDRKAVPLMFSFPNDDRQNRAILKVGDSSWSKPQSFDAIGSAVEVVLPSSTKYTEIHIGVSVEEGQGKYKLTKVVTLTPRFILKSNLQEEISFREPASARVMTLKPGKLTPLHFLQQGVAKQLCLCFPGLNNRWSSPFNISDLGRVHVKLAREGQRQELIRVDIMLEQATLFLHFSRETKVWPFSIRNESNTDFMFYQANPNSDDEDADEAPTWRPIRYRLPPRSIMPYAWDYPAAERKELVLVANGKERHVSLAEIGNLLPMKVPATQAQRPPKIIDINVIADGPTQTLILSNYQPSTSLYKQKSNVSSQSSLSTGFEVKDINTDTSLKAQIRFAGIGISLINGQMRELAYATFREVELKYSESALYQTLNATIKWIQIDNQLYGGIFPLILYPSVVPKTGKEMDVHPNLHALITRVKDDSYGVLYIKYATVLLQQMTLEIDEDFIFAFLDFSNIPGASWVEEPAEKLTDDDLDIPEPHLEQQGQDIYFELLHIQPTQLDISFVRTERVNVEDKTTSRNPLMFFLNIMTMALGNINDAPVRLNALLLENARVSLPVLSQHVQSHYSQEFLYQVHKILGSADFLGNPVGLFNNISSGVADIFYEPYQGLVMTDRPQELGIGIAKGATSFVKKSVFGVTDSMSKFTGSISKGLAAATLDKQFQSRRRMTRARNRPKHALYGVTEGANSFVTSVASGVGGLARKPFEGAEREGVAGFFKGVGKGVIGLATKPAVGVFDLASNVTEGIRNTTTVFDSEGLDRVRLPRHIGKDGIVRPYSQREALGQFWLKQLDGGKYFDEDYIAHLELPREDMVVMLTYRRIMLVRPKKLSVEWDVPLKDIGKISKELTGLSVTLKGGTNGPYIPVQEESSRNFLYRQIGIAVKDFNENSLAREP